MTISLCVNNIVRSVLSNCTNPNVGGYTGRAIILQWADGISTTFLAGNRRIITSIGLAVGSTGKPIAVDNVRFVNPFTGSSSAGNVDDGSRKVLKTFTLKVPLRGAAVSADLLEGMFIGNFRGQGAVVILEKLFKGGDGSYEVIGSESPFLINPDGLTRDEYTEGGAYVLTGSTKEEVIEYTLFDLNFQTSKADFDALWALAWNIAP